MNKILTISFISTHEHQPHHTKAQFKVMRAIHLANVIPSTAGEDADTLYIVHLAMNAPGVATGFSEKALIAAIKCVSP